MHHPEYWRWNPLHEPGSLTASQLIAHLDGLAALPLEQRAFYLGFVQPFLAHANAGVRAAAARCLAGATGMLAWRWLVAALDDEALAVRRAAAQALRLSAAREPPGIVHVLFHPDPRVREEVCPPEADPKRVPLRQFLEAHVFQCGLPPEERDRLHGFLYDIPASEPPPTAPAPAPALPDVLDPPLVPTLTGLFASGLPLTLPKLLRWWDAAPPDVREAALVLSVTEADEYNVRADARSRLPVKPENNPKLLRLAHTFAWGVEIGQYLLGQRYHLAMVVREQQFGYTRLHGSTIHVTPLPILRGERGGVDVVRGLILHEFGHHLYHKGEIGLAVWKQADKEGLGKLLNLVADEHLERNLRHRHARYGDLLKTLNAYAFQHQAREVDVRYLLNLLGERAFAVLTRVNLGAGRLANGVTISSGRLLRELDAAGLSFARFFRALRLGLGNRAGDPRVAQALALFKGRFRQATMPQLLEIARKLREIFGSETSLLDMGYSPDDAFVGDEADGLAAGAGIQGDLLDREVDRLLSEKSRPERPSEGAGGSRALNLGPHETFNEINKVVKVPHNPAEHAKYARQVARHARQLRRFFAHLGFSLRPERMRVQGRQLDRTRLRGLVLTRDPRVLISRQAQRWTDLFVGMVIDCSGSMAGASMEKARLFGTLLAEAVRGQPGIDLRIFGFTDKVIFDAGTAQRCAVHALAANGGNNDAAGLWYAYQAARRSKRRAKLLVMISDGAPTECTVAALRGLVRRLTQWKCCCAQVAVQPLSEICFPHYVLLQEHQLDACVRQFGAVIMRLVGAALGK
jgi:hypothetical protein